MNQSNYQNKTHTSSLIAKNTVYNLLGNTIPILFAIAFIPPLIDGLGTERFGILSIAWMIIGYFGFFDFGIGKGLTKDISEKIGLNQTETIPTVFWSSIILMSIISLVAALLLSFFIPTFIDLFNISTVYKQETMDTFFILAFSIPIVVSMAGLRGVLEAYQKFFTINLIKIFLGAITFLGPLIVLVITNSLFWIVFFLISIRILIWCIYLVSCFFVNPDIRRKIKFDYHALKPVLRFSIWITIGNFIVPIILYSDRFLIGILISAAAVTFYVTPYELVARLMMIPVSLTTVLFPVFSAGFFRNPENTKKIFLQGIKFTFLIMYPFIMMMITFSYDGLQLWLGNEFAIKSSLVLQFLSVGILMNSLSLIPNNFFQGIGKPRIPTLINLMELPIYILLMFYSIHFYGIIGAAFTFMLMASLDSIAMYLVAKKLFSIRFDSKSTVTIFLILIAMLVVPFFVNNIMLKTTLFLTFLALYILVAWKQFLSFEERKFIQTKLKYIVK